MAVPSFAFAWGGGSDFSSTGSWGSGTWVGGGTLPSAPAASGAQINLTLTFADCAKCHVSIAAVGDTHHALIKANKLECTTCHLVSLPGASSPGGVAVVKDCTKCHAAGQLAGAPHTTDTHRIVRDACGQCHSEPVPVVHANAASSSGGGGSGFGGGRLTASRELAAGGASTSASWGGGSSSSATVTIQACLFCHASSNSNVTAVVKAGLAGQTVACSSCHGGGSRH